MSENLLDPPRTALHVLETLRRAGHETYFCGGCVRDALMGRVSKDWDITTAATPDAVEGLFPRTIPVGKAFGVMIVVEGDAHYEVATFRTDLAYQDGRHPTGVRFASAREDVERRDFTVNALLYDPEARRVIDHVGGRADLEAGLLRTVGDPHARFQEDHLRLLRAVRFAARTGFAIEAETLAAIRALAHLAPRVAAERVGDELGRMLAEGSAAPALALLAETGLLAQVLPEVEAMRGVPQPPQFHPEGDVWVHTCGMLALFDACAVGREDAGVVAGPLPDLDLTAEDRARGMEAAPLSDDERRAAVRTTWMALDSEARATLAWAVLLHDIGKPPTLTHAEDRIRFHEHDRVGAEMASAVVLRLKRPRRLAEAVADLVGRHIHMANLRQMRQAKLRRWLQEPLFPVHLELHRLDCESSHRMLANYAFGFAAWQEELARPPVRAPLLNGRDLLAMGFAPGPRLGEILRAIEDARLEGRLATPEEARAFVRECGAGGDAS